MSRIIIIIICLHPLTPMQIHTKYAHPPPHSNSHETANAVFIALKTQRKHTYFKHLVIFEWVWAEDDPFGEAMHSGSGAVVVLQGDVFATATAESVGRPWE